jgi:hypothetical protein
MSKLSAYLCMLHMYGSNNNKCKETLHHYPLNATNLTYMFQDEPCGTLIPSWHRINMELDLQSLFGLLCAAVLID